MNIDEIAQAFTEEAHERLDNIVASLLALEGGAPLADVIDALFRDAHSIKGGAGMMGFDDAYALAHALEDALGEVRRRSQMPPALIDPLLHGSDLLRRAVTGADVDVRNASAELAATVEAAFSNGAERTEERSADGDAPALENQSSESPPAGRVSIRVDSAKVDRVLDAVGETVLHHNRLEHEFGAAEQRELLEQGEKLLGGLQDAAIQLRTVPLASIAGRFPRGVREVAAAEGKEVDFEFTDTDAQVDRALLDGTSDAIAHLLRNAVAHGIERPDERERAGKRRSGRVALHA